MPKTQALVRPLRRRGRATARSAGDDTVPQRPSARLSPAGRWCPRRRCLRGALAVFAAGRPPRIHVPREGRSRSPREGRGVLAVLRLRPPPCRLSPALAAVGGAVEGGRARGQRRGRARGPWKVGARPICKQSARERGVASAMVPGEDYSQVAHVVEEVATVAWTRIGIAEDPYETMGAWVACRGREAVPEVGSSRLRSQNGRRRQLLAVVLVKAAAIVLEAVGTADLDSSTGVVMAVMVAGVVVVQAVLEDAKAALEAAVAMEPRQSLVAAGATPEARVRDEIVVATTQMSLEARTPCFNNSDRTARPRRRSPGLRA